jgi:hypothetical protein
MKTKVKASDFCGECGHRVDEKVLAKGWALLDKRKQMQIIDMTNAWYHCGHMALYKYKKLIRLSEFERYKYKIVRVKMVEE